MFLVFTSYSVSHVLYIAYAHTVDSPVLCVRTMFSYTMYP